MEGKQNLDIKGLLQSICFLSFFLCCNKQIIRIKLDSSELEGSTSSVEIASSQAAVPVNMKTQAAFVNKLYK